MIIEKVNKKLPFVLCILLLISFITGCGVSDDKKGIYTDNAKIAQDGDSFSYSRRSSNGSNGEINVNFTSFYGTETIWIIESKGDGQVTFEYNSTVKKGDFKAVLINPKKEIEDIFTGSEKSNKKIKLSEGKYLFKIVGKDAKGEVELSISKNENVTITKK